MSPDVIKIPQTMDLTCQTHSLPTKKSVGIAHAQHFWRKADRPCKSLSRQKVSLCWNGQLFSLHRGTTPLQMVPLKCVPWWRGDDFYPASTAWIGAQVVHLNKSSKLTMGKFHFVTKPSAGRVLLHFECCRFHSSRPWPIGRNWQTAPFSTAHGSVLSEDVTQWPWMEKSTF